MDTNPEVRDNRVPRNGVRRRPLGEVVFLAVYMLAAGLSIAVVASVSRQTNEVIQTLSRSHETFSNFVFGEVFEVQKALSAFHELVAPIDEGETLEALKRRVERATSPMINYLPGVINNRQPIIEAMILEDPLGVKLRFAEIGAALGAHEVVLSAMVRGLAGETDRSQAIEKFRDIRRISTEIEKDLAELNHLYSQIYSLLASRINADIEEGQRKVRFLGNLLMVVFGLIVGGAIMFFLYDRRIQRVRERRHEHARQRLQDMVELRRTDLEVAEDRLRLTLENIGEGILAVNREGRVLMVNPAAARLLGFETPKLVLGRDAHPFIFGGSEPGDGKPPPDSALSRTLRHGSRVRVEQATFYTVSRLPIEVAYETYPLRREGKISGAVLHFVDLSDWVKRQSQMIQIQKMDALGTLAGGIAHDFNNMLTPILALSQLSLRSVPESDRLHLRLEKIIQAAQRAKDLANRILTFSRQSNLQVSHQPFDISLVVRESVGLLQSTLPSSMTLNVSIHPECGTVLGNASQIQSVLMNLCSNAADAMEGHAGVLTISLKPLSARPRTLTPHPRGGRYAELSVIDNGKGMDENTIKLIFNPFFTTKEVGRGTGLGLSMAHGIIHEHGGDITVESKPGKGSTFRVFLPLMRKERVKSAKLKE